MKKSKAGIRQTEWMAHSSMTYTTGYIQTCFVVVCVACVVNFVMESTEIIQKWYQEKQKNHKNGRDSLLKTL